VSIGSIAGLLAPFVVMKFLRSLLFEVAPTSIAQFAGATALLMVVGMVAVLLPAWRAARTQPSSVLRGGLDLSISPLGCCLTQRMTSVPRRLLGDFGQDLRFAWRQLRRAHGFTTLAVATLAIGIGVNAIMAGALDRLLLRPPRGVGNPGDVVRLVLAYRSASGSTNYTGGTFNYPTFLGLERDVPAFADVAAYTAADLPFGTGRDAVPARTWLVSSTFFSTLGISPAAGRTFATADGFPKGDASGGSPVAVLGYEFWQRQFGGRRSVIGTNERIGHRDYTIIGVAPPGLWLTEPLAPDVIVPITVAGEADAPALWFGGLGSTWLTLVGRLRPGATREVASRQATLVLRDGNMGPVGDSTASMVAASIIPGRGPDAPRDARIALWLGGVSIIVLLIACVNVANLLLSRAFIRRREVAIRVALGAGRWRLTRQLIAEGLLLSALGAAAALVLCMLGGRLLQGELATGESNASVVDLRLLGFVACIALGVAIVVSLAPLLYGFHADVSDRARLNTGALGGRAARMRFIFLTLQAAVCLPLVVGAGLFVTSLQRVARLDLGMDVDHTVKVTFDLNELSLPAAQAQAALARMEANVRALPGVERVALGEYDPYRGGYAVAAQTPERGEDETLVRAWTTHSPMAAAVDSGFFRAVGATSLRGRDFDSHDRSGGERVAIVNETLARLLWPGRDALGRCMMLSDTDRACVRIVGVLGGFWRRSILDRDQLLVYLPLTQAPFGSGWPRMMFVRVSHRSAALTHAIERAVREARPDLGAVHAVTLHDVLEPQFKPWRVAATMFGLFGGVAMAICLIGLYGVVSFNAQQRSAELAVRIALGAQARHILSTVVGAGLATVTIGLALGAAVAVIAGRAMAAMLFQTSGDDPAIVLSSAGLLLVVSVAAGLIPTIRVLRKSPADVLRHD
jgi:predicted permease